MPGLLLEARLVRALRLPRLIAGKMAEQQRDNVFPLVGEVTDQTVRLSMNGDPRIREASDRLGSACAGLLERAFEPGAIAGQEAELNNALLLLRLARDLAATPKWHWRQRIKLKRRMAEAPQPPGIEASMPGIVVAKPELGQP